MLKQIYQSLASKKLAIALFAGICIFSIPGTFMEERDIYSSMIVRFLFGLMGLNLTFCTIKRIKSLSQEIIVIHLGGLLVIFGGVISSFGFLATVNVYEGSMTDKVYRWDARQDMPLGFNLAVKKINTEYYPVPVRVGVLRGEEKIELFELRTGENFKLGNFIVKAEDFELPSENLNLSVFENNKFMGSANTSGESALPANFPYRFVLVAFHGPNLKRVWVDLSISDSTGVVAEGISEVNRPFKWKDLNFYNTEINMDKYGQAYAGIQVTRDPGRSYIFIGFGIIGIGALMYLLKKLLKAGK